jgi:hypothetical protein
MRSEERLEETRGPFSTHRSWVARTRGAGDVDALQAGRPILVPVSTPRVSEFAERFGLAGLSRALATPPLPPRPDPYREMSDAPPNDATTATAQLVSTMTDILVRIEWSTLDHICPDCWAPAHHGHYDTCRLDATLTLVGLSTKELREGRRIALHRQKAPA